MEAYMHVANTGDANFQPRTGQAMFTGEVNSAGLVDDTMTEQTRLLLVKFSPGGRTKWHTHSFEQALIIVEGKGLVGSEKDGERVVQPGDVVVFGKQERHWHGAGLHTGMAHIAVNLSPGENQIFDAVDIQTEGV
jgi:quercetin dioxygenase-like cupin family protein